IRAILLDPVNTDMDPGAELFLYAADRRQHISEVIRPALESGKTVICDRFHDSTIAYQGFSRQLDGELIQTLNRWVLDGLSPDMTFLLDLEPSVGLERAWQEVDQGRRAEQEMRFEHEALSFHRNVREGYLELARQAPDRFVVIDAAGDKDKVWTAVQAALDSRISAG
ncbi:MAG: dTMP kinase, partial [Thermodesulfobacteriota bacterium]